MSQRTVCWLLAAVLIAGALALSVQGYRGRLNGFNYDQIINIDEALRLVDGAGLPEKGGLCSFGSHIPPGTCWLLVPGVMTGEPRLYEVVGPFVLELATLAGLFLLVKSCTDEATALLAAVLYALSPLGMMFGSSLWPRANPCAYVWMAWCTVGWIQRRNAWHLAGAIVAWGVGMLIYLEMAPAILMLVVAWLVYRPPLRVGAVALATLVVAAVWYPYLSFESRREPPLIDLKSQLLSGSLHPNASQDLAKFGDALGTWDEQQGELGPYVPHQPTAAPTGIGNLIGKLGLRAWLFARNLLDNFFEFTPAGFFPAALFCLTMVVAANRQFHLADRLQHGAIWPWLGAVCLLAVAAVNPWTAPNLAGKSLGADGVRIVQSVDALLVALSLLLVLHRIVGQALQKLDARLSPATALSPETTRAGSLATLIWILVGPWLGLAIAATNAKYQWGLWPLQVAVLAGAACYYVRRLAWPRCARLGLLLAVVACVAINVPLRNRIGDWRRSGYAGADTVEIQAADFLAERLRASGQCEARIGYHLFFNSFEALGHDADPRYYIGSPINHYLQLRWEIAAANQPAEGYSPGDEYRVVETAPRSFKPHRFRFADPQVYRLIARFGTIQVWQRANAAAPADTASPSAASKG